MNDQALKWIVNIPVRWARNGLIIGVVWSAIGIGLVGMEWPKNPDEVLRVIRGLVFVFVQVVAPTVLVGLTWGLFTKRRLLALNKLSDADAATSVANLGWRCAVEGAAIGIIFAFYLDLTGTGTPKLQSWSNADAVIMENIPAIMGRALSAVFIGWLAGWVLRRNLRKRLTGTPNTKG
jgi:hypothetical protein